MSSKNSCGDPVSFSNLQDLEIDSKAPTHEEHILRVDGLTDTVTNSNITYTDNTYYTTGGSHTFTPNPGTQWTSPTYTWEDSEKTQLREEIKHLRETNEKLMEKLFWIMENPKVLEKFPALEEAYREYMFVRRLVLNDDEDIEDEE